MFTLTTDTITRFWRKIEIRPESTCWHWKGSMTSDKGGGRRVPKMCLGGREILGRRIAYQLIHGHCPKYLRNTCGNPRCVNPAHLVDVTSEAGKQFARTEQLSRQSSKQFVRLNREAIRAILTLWQNGRTLAEIERATGIPTNRVSCIVAVIRAAQKKKLVPLRGQKRQELLEKSRVSSRT